MTRLPPPAVVRIASAVRTQIQALTRKMVPPGVALLELASGFTATHAVYAAARLGLADALALGPRSTSDVADAVEADPDATSRLLRALATYGVVQEERDGRYGLTALGQALRSDTGDSVLPVILMLGDSRYQGMWGQLDHTVRTGRPGAEEVLGSSMWDYLDRDADFAGIFNDAMTRLSALDWPAVAAVYDFSRYSTIVDIGGGHGQLLALMLHAAPSATGVLLEREPLRGPAEDHLREQGVLTRCRVEAGSFFETAPADGDLYVLRRVVHDYDDDQALAILTTVRSHAPTGAKLVLLESVVPPGNTPHFAKLLDLDMMLFAGGRERTEPEFRDLLERAGWSSVRVVPTVSTISLIEAETSRSR